MTNAATINTELVYQPSQTTHWKNLFPSKMMLLGSQNLNQGEELVAKIRHVEIQQIKSSTGMADDVPVVTFENAPPMVLNITNVKTIASLYGPSSHHWKGPSIQVYATMVKAFGSEVMALRVRAVIPDTNEDIDVYFNNLAVCKTMQQLKEAFTAIPKHLKARLTEHKNNMKNQIGAANVQG